MSTAIGGRDRESTAQRDASVGARPPRSPRAGRLGRGRALACALAGLAALAPILRPAPWLAPVLAMGLAFPAPSHAAEIEGVQFDDSVEIDGQSLALNGMGLRELYVVKTWVAALYAPEPIRSAAVLISDAGPRRIAVTLLADLSIERLARSVLEALKRNHDPILLATIEKQVSAFVAALASIGPTEKGDTLTLDLAGGATRVGFNGMRVGEPIEGLLFRDALLRAFVGEKPIDEGLRRGLLGLGDEQAPDGSTPDPGSPAPDSGGPKAEPPARG